MTWDIDSQSFKQNDRWDLDGAHIQEKDLASQLRAAQEKSENVHGWSINLETIEPLLCDLEDTAFERGGAIQSALSNAGYDESAEIVIGRIGAWNMTFSELKKSLEFSES